MTHRPTAERLADKYVPERLRPAFVAELLALLTRVESAEFTRGCESMGRALEVTHGFVSEKLRPRV